VFLFGGLTSGAVFLFGGLTSGAVFLFNDDAGSTPPREPAWRPDLDVRAHVHEFAAADRAAAHRRLDAVATRDRCELELA